MNKALIIDDEPDIRELLEITLSRMDIHCSCAEDIRTAKDFLKNGDYQICLTDMRLPDGDGLDFVSYIQSKYPNIPVAVITAHGNMETAIQALKSGAFDFLTKPIDLPLLRTLVKNAINLTNIKSYDEKELVGNSKAIIEIRETITKLARSQAPVYISGESGVGKEMVARMIHDLGPRSTGPFVPVNCGAIPHELMESEFFGHKKGSFTGAHSDKRGLFHAADGGTLFLDEIAELPQNMQVKLLRVIQEKKIRPIGEHIEIPVNVRILSATHKDLNILVKENLFRKDLFYRINVIELKVPPLRERQEDIPVLVDHIINRIIKEYGTKKPELSKEVLESLKQYNYPGNVRELENIIERAMALSDGRNITIDDLQLSNSGKVPTEVDDPNINEDVKLDSYLGKIEKKVIIEALEKTKWNKTAAAKLLGISFRALRYRLEKLGID